MRPRCLLVALLLTCWSPCPLPLAAQSPRKASDAFFADPRVRTLEIELGTKELEALRRDPRKYVPCTLKDGAEVYPRVGIHLKGAAGSFRGIDDRPGLTLNMNKFGAEKLFHGMDKFHLANSVQDNSYVNELLASEMFRAAGIPASRITHAFVVVAGRKRGLYYLKEGYDKYFLKRHFGTASGNLYDGGFLRDIDQPLKLLRGKNDVQDHADLKALTAAVREPKRAVRLQKLEKSLALDKFVDFLCLETLIWDWDGYPMNRNNYRVHHDAARDRITFFPSGMDQLFGDPNGPLFPNFQGMVARAYLEIPEGRKRYVDRMDHLLRTVFVPEVLDKRLDDLQRRLQPVLASIDPGLGRNYPNEIARIRNAIRQRARVLREQVDRELKK